MPFCLLLEISVIIPCYNEENTIRKLVESVINSPATIKELIIVDDYSSDSTSTILKELEGPTTYELPDHLLGIIWKGKYKGQKQKWFLMRFLGNDSEINTKTNKPEFLEWKWLDLDKLTDVVVDFKFDVYKELKEKIKKIIN